jgi:hypothetical protein
MMFAIVVRLSRTGEVVGQGSSKRRATRARRPRRRFPQPVRDAIVRANGVRTASVAAPSRADRARLNNPDRDLEVLVDPTVDDELPARLFALDDRMIDATRGSRPRRRATATASRDALVSSPSTCRACRAPAVTAGDAAASLLRSGPLAQPHKWTRCSS